MSSACNAPQSDSWSRLLDHIFELSKDTPSSLCPDCGCVHDNVVSKIRVVGPVRTTDNTWQFWASNDQATVLLDLVPGSTLYANIRLFPTESEQDLNKTEPDFEMEIYSDKEEKITEMLDIGGCVSTAAFLFGCNKAFFEEAIKQNKPIDIKSSLKMIQAGSDETKHNFDLVVKNIKKVS